MPDELRLILIYTTEEERMLDYSAWRVLDFAREADEAAAEQLRLSAE